MRYSTVFALLFTAILGLSPIPSTAQMVPAKTEPPTATSEATAADAASKLLAVLQDPVARDALIAQLKEVTARAPGTGDAPQPAGSPATALTSETPSVAQNVASATLGVARDGATQLNQIGSQLARLSVLGTWVSENAPRLAPRLGGLVLTIASTGVIFALLGALVGRLGRRLMPRPGERFARRARGAGIVLAARIGEAVVALIAGYALSTFVFGEGGAPSDAQTLYLNALAVFAGGAALLGLLVSPDADRLPALSSIAPVAQGVVYRRLRTVLGCIAFGFLFLMPLAQLWGGYIVARPFRTLIATVSAAVALLAIRRVSRVVGIARNDARHPLPDSDDAGAVMAAGAHSLWRSAWPPLAYVYVIYCWVIALVQPGRVSELVLVGTAYTAGGVLVMLIALRLLSNAPSVRAPLPRAVLGAVPRLGPRADRIAGALSWATSAVLLVAAVCLVLNGWGWVDMQGFLARAAVQAAIWRLLSALLVAVIAALIWAVVASWVDHRLTDDFPGQVNTARKRTLLALFRNAFTIAIAILAIMITLSQLGLDIAPLLASAGVVGLAIGFGSQKLVQDIITGLFIQLENAINEGDVVGVAGITGGVEKVTIRSVRLRTLDGAVHIVPFSAVSTVTNLTRDFAFHVAEIGVAYKEKVPLVKEAMEEAFARLKAEPVAEGILAPLDMQGVISLGDSSVVIRARIKTIAGSQWGIGRRYTELVKEVLDERNIEIPFPHRQLVFPAGGLPLLGSRPAPGTDDAEPEKDLGTAPLGRDMPSSAEAAASPDLGDESSDTKA